MVIKNCKPQEFSPNAFGRVLYCASRVCLGILIGGCAIPTLLFANRALDDLDKATKYIEMGLVQHDYTSVQVYALHVAKAIMHGITDVQETPRYQGRELYVLKKHSGFRRKPASRSEAKRIYKSLDVLATVKCYATDTIRDALEQIFSEQRISRGDKFITTHRRLARKHFLEACEREDKSLLSLGSLMMATRVPADIKQERKVEYKHSAYAGHVSVRDVNFLWGFSSGIFHRNHAWINVVQVPRLEDNNQTILGALSGITVEDVEGGVDEGFVLLPPVWQGEAVGAVQHHERSWRHRCWHRLLSFVGTSYQTLQSSFSSQDLLVKILCALAISKPEETLRTLTAGVIDRELEKFQYVQMAAFFSGVLKRQNLSECGPVFAMAIITHQFMKLLEHRRL